MNQYEDKRKIFYRKNKIFWRYFFLQLIAIVFIFLLEKAIGKNSIIYSVLIILMVLIFVYSGIGLIVLGMFSIKNRIAFLRPHVMLMGQEHTGWQAIITGLFTVLLGIVLLFFSGLFVYFILG